MLPDGCYSQLVTSADRSAYGNVEQSVSRPMPHQFSLRSLMLAVAVCAAQAFAYVQIGIVDWLLANALLGMAYCSILAIRHKRWRRLTLGWSLFTIGLGILIPGLQPNVTHDSQQFVCTKCAAEKFVSSRKRFMTGALYGAAITEDSMEFVEGTARNCRHNWSLWSCSTRRFRYVFGLTVPLSREIMCSRPMMATTPPIRPVATRGGS